VSGVRGQRSENRREEGEKIRRSEGGMIELGSWEVEKLRSWEDWMPGDEADIRKQRDSAMFHNYKL